MNMLYIVMATEANYYNGVSLSEPLSSVFVRQDALLVVQYASKEVSVLSKKDAVATV